MKKLQIESLRRFAEKRPPGYLEDVLRAGLQEDGFVYLGDAKYEALVKKYRPPTTGAGTELKALLAKVGIKSSPTCSCNKRAKTMDDNGIEWCEQNVETICDWLAEESAKRKLPFVRLAGKALIHLAIRRAKKATNK